MMNKTKLIILFTLTLFCNINVLEAQDRYVVTAYVKDSLTQEPLVGVLISYGDNEYTETNAYGFFSIYLDSANEELTLNCFGYYQKKYIVVPDKQSKIDIYMTPLSIEIDDVVIKDMGHKFGEIQKLGGIALDAKQLNYIPSFLGEKDIFKYFQLFAGVNSGKEGSSDINIRGGSSDQTLILIDDIPIYSVAHAFDFVSVFNGNTIKSAELYKGYIPIEYGNRLSGVVTMNIREGNRLEHKQEIQLGTTTISALAEGYINKGRGSYLVSARTFTPGVAMSLAKKISHDSMNDMSMIAFSDLTAKMCYDIGSEGTIYGSLYLSNDKIHLLDTKDYLYDSKTAMGWGNLAGSLRFSSSVGERTSIHSTMYYTQIYNEVINNYNEEIEQVRSTYESSVTSKMKELGLKVNFESNIAKSYKVQYGTNIAFQEFTPNNIKYVKNNLMLERDYNNIDLISSTLFVENKLSFRNMKLNLGARLSVYDNSEKTEISFEPRLSLQYYLDNSSIWLSFTKNTQPLFSMNNQLMESLPVDYWIAFSGENKLQTSNQISLGYKRKIKKNLEFSVEAYYKESNNMTIVYNGDDFLVNQEGFDTVNGKAYGIEFLGMYKYQKFNAMLSYTFSKSQYNYKGELKDFIFDSPHNLNLLTSYITLNNKIKNHVLSLNISYKSGMPYNISTTTYPIKEFYDNSSNTTIYSSPAIYFPIHAECRLTNFFRVDLNYSMEKQLIKGSRIWQLSLLNATAHNNPYLVFYKHTDKEFKGIQLIPFLPSFSYVRKF